MPVPETQRTDAPSHKVADSEAREVGAASTGTQLGAAPRWLVPVLVVAAIGMLGLNLAAFDGSAAGWIVLAGILVTLIGVVIALNPRRGSVAGGSAER